MHLGSVASLALPSLQWSLPSCAPLRCTAVRASGLQASQECAALEHVLGAVGSVLHTRMDAEKAVKKALREGQRDGSLTDADARGSAAAVIFCASIWRARLAYVVGQVSHGRPPRGRAYDALLLTLLLSNPSEFSSIHPPAPSSWSSFLAREIALKDRWVYEALRTASSAPIHIRWPIAMVPQIAIMYSLPCGLIRDWRRRLPAKELKQLAATCNTRGPAVLRVNVERADRHQVLEALRDANVPAELGNLSPWAIKLIGDRTAWGGSAWALPGWSAAHFELQDEGSQMIVHACEVQEGEIVLDMCAGRGGKTLALASMVGRTGQVLAHDVDTKALRQLAAAAKRTGIETRLSVFANDANMPTNPSTASICLHRSEGGPSWYSGGYADVRFSEPHGVDLVLVDAPCSSSGVLRRHPGLRWSGRWAGSGPRQMAALQLEILCAAATMVKPGGRLVYATCALETIDDETADAFEAGHPEMRPWNFELCKKDVGAQPEKSQGPRHRRTLWPHHLGTDGFYIARWRRTP